MDNEENDFDIANNLEEWEFIVDKEIHQKWFGKRDFWVMVVTVISIVIFMIVIILSGCVSPRF